MSTAEKDVIEYLMEGRATNDECDDFLDWCLTLGKAGGKKARYEIYRLWARILRKRRTPFSPRDMFIFADPLKNYLRKISGGDITDDPPRVGAKDISNDMFVKYVVKYLDDGF